MSELDKNIILLTDDEGNEIEFEHIDTIELNEEIYMAFIPANLPVEEDAEVVILKVITEGDEEILATPETEEEMNAVFNVLMDRMDEEEDEDETTED